MTTDAAALAQREKELSESSAAAAPEVIWALDGPHFIHVPSNTHWRMVVAAVQVPDPDRGDIFWIYEDEHVLIMLTHTFAWEWRFGHGHVEHKGASASIGQAIRDALRRANSVLAGDELDDWTPYKVDEDSLPPIRSKEP